MLRVHARVSPPFRPVPRPEQAKQEIYRQTRNGRTGIKRGGDNVYKVLVECGPALCDVAVGEDGDGGAGENDVGRAGGEQVRERRAERGASEPRSWPTTRWREGETYYCGMSVAPEQMIGNTTCPLALPSPLLPLTPDEAHLVQLIPRPPPMRPPQHHRHERTERKTEIQHAILAREETRGADCAPDDARAVEDLRPAARPLPRWVYLCAVEVGTFGAQDGLEGYVWPVS